MERQTAFSKRIAFGHTLVRMILATRHYPQGVQETRNEGMRALGERMEGGDARSRTIDGFQ